MGRKPTGFDNVDTAADDIGLIAFTSGTTGQPKGTVHFHRDILAMCDCFPKHVYRPSPDDIYVGTPPLAFTFGLGAQLLFPMRTGASVVFYPGPPGPDLLLDLIDDIPLHDALYGADHVSRARRQDRGRRKPRPHP